MSRPLSLGLLGHFPGVTPRPPPRNRCFPPPTDFDSFFFERGRIFFFQFDFIQVFLNPPSWRFLDLSSTPLLPLGPKTPSDGGGFNAGSPPFPNRIFPHLPRVLALRFVSARPSETLRRWTKKGARLLLKSNSHPPSLLNLFFVRRFGAPTPYPIRPLETLFRRRFPKGQPLFASLPHGRRDFP